MDPINSNINIGFQHAVEEGSYEKRSKIKELLKDQPAAQYALGLAVYPFVYTAQTVAVAFFNKLDDNFIKYNLNMLSGNIYHYLTNPKAIIRPSIIGVGQEVVCREFVQSYLLDKKLSCILSKISPKIGEFPKTRSGAALRIVLTSAFFSWLNIAEDASKGKYYQELIFQISSGMLREITGSIVPSIAMGTARWTFSKGW